MTHANRIRVLTLTFAFTLAATSARAEEEAPPPPAETPPPATTTPPAATTPSETPLPVATPPAATVSEEAVPAQPPAWLKGLSIGGGALLWYYQPVGLEGVNHNIDLFFANLLLDGKFGRLGLHIEPRFRDSRLRAFYPGPVWAQEVYASAALGRHTVLKAGKAYSRFGLFWDNSFYGNVQVYDGLKLDPNYGLSLEGAVRPEADSGLRYFAQFFIVDGQTNVSLDGRDTISIPGARRRNQAVLRAEPFVKFGPSATLVGGLSGAYLQADLPVVGKQNVWRAAVDASFTLRRWSVWAEYTRQDGQTVTAFPVAPVAATPATPATPGAASANNNYVLAGTQLALGPVTLRYNVSTGRYEDLSIVEWMHVPAAAYALNDNFNLLAEYVHWTRFLPGGGSARVDRSLNVTLAGHF